MSDTESFGLLLAFDSDSPEFVRGFEAGRVWALLDEDGQTMTFYLHATNLEMAIRIGEQTGHTCTLVGETDTWITVEYMKASS